MLRLSAYSVKDATKWLSNHGLSVSGTKRELNQRIGLYERYPKLAEKLRKRSAFNRTFACALEKDSVPPITAPWKPDREAWPLVTEKMFNDYCAHKRAGNLGQQAKAVKMLESRKIVNVKTLLMDDHTLFVRALINPSYSNTTRPAVVLFTDDKPVKGYCECPVGSSGICCHILALLLFLKHYWETGVELLELTCTQQLQKWHRRCRKGSIPMLPLAQIKVKAAKVRKAKSRRGAPKIVPADPENSYFKRDVPTLMKNAQKLIELSGIPVMDHFHSILSQSRIGQQSSFGAHINQLYSTRSLQHHDYAEPYEEPPTLTIVPNHNATLLCELSSQMTSELPMNSIIEQDVLPIHVVWQQPKMYATDDCRELEMDIKKQLSVNNSQVTIDISSRVAPTPCGANYIICDQRSELWKAVRRGKVTGSRLPNLLGLHGKEKFEEDFNIVMHNFPEKDRSHIPNFRRGIQFEDAGVKFFENISKSKTEKAGFFIHPTRMDFGASPDALCASGVLLEVKTRAANSEGPLESLKDFSSYFVQCQLQMACTNAHSCILLSYHPESKRGNFFLITRDSHLMGIMIEVMESMMKGVPITQWNHKESAQLVKVGETLIHKPIDFENLRKFRSYIKSYTKLIPRLDFTYVDFTNHAAAQ